MIIYILTFRWFINTDTSLLSSSMVILRKWVNSLSYTMVGPWKWVYISYTTVGPWKWVYFIFHGRSVKMSQNYFIYHGRFTGCREWSRQRGGSETPKWAITKPGCAVSRKRFTYRKICKWFKKNFDFLGQNYYSLFSLLIPSKQSK